MKTKCLLITLLTLLLAACSDTKTISNGIFSVDVPVGFRQGTDDIKISVPGLYEVITLDNLKGSVAILAYPGGLDPEKFLFHQTFGHENESLTQCRFSDIEKCDIEGRKGYSLMFEGPVEGSETKGKIYTFEKGNHTFMVISCSKNGESSKTNEIIRSIKILAENQNADEQLTLAVNVGKSVLPIAIDEVTTWVDVKRNDKEKRVENIMQVAGSVEDYNLEAFNDIIKEQTTEMITTLREDYDSNLIFMLAEKLGYDLVYQYKTAQEGIILGEIVIHHSDYTRR